MVGTLTYRRGPLTRTNVTPEDLHPEVDRPAGPRGRSGYVAEAVTQRVKRDGLARASRATAGAVADRPVLDTTVQLDHIHGESAANRLLEDPSAADERAAHERVTVQRRCGLDPRWVSAEEAMRINPFISMGGMRGATYCPTDGLIDPPRNVHAYSLALQRAGVELRERTPMTGLQIANGRLTGVDTRAGTIATERVLLAAGPSFRELGRDAGVKVWAGGARHHVWTTEPDAQQRRRAQKLIPRTRALGMMRVWAATIDYTPDHLPILGEVPGRRGVFVAAAGGHGIMWGPAVARVAADLISKGATDVVDVTGLGLGRFDEHRRSKLASDPVALPFPAAAD